jgi:ubiquinone/menaquinone biosynthesis C-methylase UbiE
MNNEHWQLDGSAAELYQRYLVPAITVKWSEDLVDRAQPRAGEAVLDVACGTGVVARSVARIVAQGRVTGLDLNAGMLAVARTLPNDGAPINWIEGSALDLPLPSESFDLVLCQLGLQFFPNQERAVQEMRRVLRNTGRVALSVYSPIERTPGAYAFALALDDILGTGASRIKRSEHSFVDAAQLETLINNSGFRAVDVEAVQKTIAFPSVLDYVRFQLLATPMAVLMKDRTEADRQAIIASVASKTSTFSTPAMLEGDRFTFPQEAYVAIAKCSC